MAAEAAPRTRAGCGDSATAPATEAENRTNPECKSTRPEGQMSGEADAADAGPRPDTLDPAMPPHEQIHREAVARIAAIEVEWTQALQAFADRGLE